MSWTVDKSEHHDFTITSPDGEEAGITIRKLTYGEVQKRQQVGVRTPKGKFDPNKVKIDPVASDFYTILQAVVSWEIPLPLKKESLAQLDPEVISQIKKKIVKVNPAIKQTFGDDEDDDETEEEEENYGLDEDEEVSGPELHAVEDEAEAEAQEQVFGEEEGPTENAATS